MCINKKRIINRLYKVLCVYEQNNEYYVEYLDTIIVELSGYSQDSNFNEIQRQMLYEASIALMGLKKLNNYDTITHKTIRRIVLKHVNKLAEIFKE